jgi:hypothetical protein
MYLAMRSTASESRRASRRELLEEDALSRRVDSIRLFHLTSLRNKYKIQSLNFELRAMRAEDV